MYPPHTGVEMAVVIDDSWKEWNLDKKVFSITLDNVTSNDTLQTILKGHLNLQNSLLCYGEFFHVHCSSHILNLIIQEGLKVASDSLFAVRESVKHVRKLDGRKQKFELCVEQIEIDINVGLRLDVSTRWNSTYLMLESALSYEKVFDCLHFHDRPYVHRPTLDQWRRAEKICEVLEPFNEITNLLSDLSYPTSNLYFMQIWIIECMLDEKLNNENEVITKMTSKMHEKFEKYWK
ncbi:zinc finger BED domain-containing protein RICESLEEPER 2-like [Capsicum galapagoense]